MKLTKRVLANRAKPCEFRWVFQNDQLANNMFEFMTRNNGIGLAAPQIGLSVRLFVMDIEGRRWACFNPEVLEYSDILADYTEGCLSFPRESCIIKRPLWIRVRYHDSAGVPTEERLEGLEARCFQHELDHLDGITMWDRYEEQHAEQS